MKIGVPKEIKPQENRIGLTPESVKTLVSEGHNVIVENIKELSNNKLTIDVEKVKELNLFHKVTRERGSKSYHSKKHHHKPNRPFRKRRMQWIHSKLLEEKA